MTSDAITQPIKWHGGKFYLRDWIISLMPPHTHYVEPYFGGGAVLLGKDPEGVSEVVNDLNGRLINFWKALQTEHLFTRFVRMVEATPFAEDEFRFSATPDGEHWKRGIVEDAWAFFVQARQSRQGLMKDFATLSRNRTRRGMNEQVSSWLTAVEGLPEVHARLKRVVILNRPALDVIRQQDGPKTLFYLDPPYRHETRVTTSDYQEEMSDDDHRALLVRLGGRDVADAMPHSWIARNPWSLEAKPITGAFLLSGYPSSMYADAADAAGWHCITREIDNKASSQAVKPTKTEALWMNFTPAQAGGGEPE